MRKLISSCRDLATSLDHKSTWHSFHGILEIGYLTFYLTEGFSLRSVFVLVLIVHSGIEVCSRD